MFTCLDLIISFIREGSYESLPGEDKNLIHRTLFDWICNKAPEVINAVPEYLKKKYAVLFALLIKVDYPQSWPDVFEVALSSRLSPSPCSTCALCRNRTSTCISASSTSWTRRWFRAPEAHARPRTAKGSSQACA